MEPALYFTTKGQIPSWTELSIDEPSELAIDREVSWRNCLRNLLNFDRAPCNRGPAFCVLHPVSWDHRAHPSDTNELFLRTRTRPQVSLIFRANRCHPVRGKKKKVQGKLSARKTHFHEQAKHFFCWLFARQQATVQSNATTHLHLNRSICATRCWLDCIDRGGIFFFDEHVLLIEALNDQSTNLIQKKAYKLI